LWGRVGRADDVLVLANGEKVVPIPIEGIILAHPAVRSVVAFGHGRTQIGVIVEPAESRDIDPTDETALTAFRNDIWESVDKANHISPAFARVYKEMILVATPTKRLPRGGKGNIQRKAATALYEEEINAM
jgi:long-subunit acyl-CoA synthetase (AMP-forming)